MKKFPVRKMKWVKERQTLRNEKKNRDTEEESRKENEWREVREILKELWRKKEKEEI